jgi:hypothetical protein
MNFPQLLQLGEFFLRVPGCKAFITNVLLRESRSSFEQFRIRPQMLVDVMKISDQSFRDHFALGVEMGR